MTEDTDATIAHLTAELTAVNQRAAASVQAVARANGERDALVAAAYEAAAQTAYRSEVYQNHVTVGRIRALTPAHATAALDRIKAEARADGLREAVRVAGRHLEEKARDTYKSEEGRLQNAARCYTAGEIAVGIEAIIHASPAEPAQVTVQEAERIKVMENALAILSNQFEYGHLWAGETRSDVIRGVEKVAKKALRAIAGGRNEL